MIRVQPKIWFIAVILLASIFAIADHLVSPTSPAIASQSGGGQSCAPCGAPCALTE